MVKICLYLLFSWVTNTFLVVPRWKKFDSGHDWLQSHSKAWPICELQVSCILWVLHYKGVCCVTFLWLNMSSKEQLPQAGGYPFHDIASGLIKFTKLYLMSKYLKWKKKRKIPILKNLKFKWPSHDWWFATPSAYGSKDSFFTRRFINEAVAMPETISWYV